MLAFYVFMFLCVETLKPIELMLHIDVYMLKELN